jgi:hypothetical protein
LPAHLAGLNEKPQKKHWFNAIENWFEKALKKILKLRYLIVIGFLVSNNHWHNNPFKAFHSRLIFISAYLFVMMDALCHNNRIIHHNA